MQVAVEHDSSLLMHVPDELLRVVNGWVEQTVRFVPLPVQIAAQQGAPVVAVYDPVRIEHGYNPDHEVLPQFGCLRGQQILQQPVHHVGGLGLSRVHSACKEYAFLLAVVLQVLDQALAEPRKVRASLDKLVFVVLVKLFDVLGDRRLKEALDLAVCLLSLLGQLPGVAVLLPESLLDNVGELVVQPQLLVVVEIGVHILGDGDERDGVPGQRETQEVGLEIGLVLLCLREGSDSLLHLSVRGRYGVRKPHLVVLIRLELVLEAEREVGFDALSCPIVVVQESVVVVFVQVHLLAHFTSVADFRVPGDVILGIGYLLTPSEPLCPVFLESLLRPDAGLHALLVQAGGLGQVQNVKFYAVSFLLRGKGYVPVDDLEVVPLRMALRVEIIFEPQIVLDVVHLRNFAEVAVFKPAVKDQHVLEVRDEDVKLGMIEVSLWLKPSQVSIKMLVIVAREVSFSSFLSEEVLDNFFSFLLAEQNIGVNLGRLIRFEVLDNFLTAGELRIRVIDDGASHLLPAVRVALFVSHGLLWLFELFWTRSVPFSFDSLLFLAYQFLSNLWRVSILIS